MTGQIKPDIVIITGRYIPVKYKFRKRGKRMATVMTNLKISQSKVQLRMAELCMNPYDLCSKAGISYASYRRIMKAGGCKIATLGKLAQALETKVTEILED